MSPLDLSFDAVATKLAGVAGAAVSMNFIKGTFPRRLTLAICGALVSNYTSEWISGKTGLPVGMAGFLLGLFGMAIVSRSWEFVEATPIGSIWQSCLDWIKPKGGSQ